MMRPMNGWTCFLLLAAAACGAGDDVADGTRALCAEGGELNDCPATPRTAQEACWRLVDCGAIPLHHAEDYVRDWDNCVQAIEGMLDPAQRLTIACIGASTCDQLRLDTGRCFSFGAN
jgi:hypothetical protein